MKKFLFSLIFGAVYAAANTCTEAVFEYETYGFIYTKDHAHLDSSYYIYNSGTSESSEKYVYSNEHLDYFTANTKQNGENIVRTVKFYWNSNESVLSKKGLEYLGKTKYSGDTLISTFTNYIGGEVHEEIIFKTSNKSLEAQYPDGPNGELALEQLYFQNDSLIKKFTYNYSTDSAYSRKYIIVDDPTNNFKCIEYNDDGEISDNFVYTQNDKGYSIKRFDIHDSHEDYHEFFMAYPDGISSIHKRRAQVKISPKARYFDLLGRYKFTK